MPLKKKYKMPSLNKKKALKFLSNLSPRPSLLESITSFKQEVISKIQTEYTKKSSELSKYIELRFKEVKQLIMENQDRDLKEMDGIRKVLNTAANTKDIEKEFRAKQDAIDRVDAEISALKDNIELNQTMSLEEVVQLENDLKRLRVEILSRINTGGGSMPFQISLGGTITAKRYADINFIGSGITVSGANNDTTKRTDITFTSTTPTPPVFSTVTGGTAGSVIFSNGTNLTEDNPNFYRNTTDATNRYGLKLGNVSGALNNWSLYLGTGQVYLGDKITTYNSIATAGWGVPAVYGSGRSVAQTAAVASVATYTVGAADGSFLIASNVNVTTSTAHNFTVTCAYTDETNTARTLTLSFIQIGGGTPIATITNVTGAGPYEGVPNHIRCKASTAITIATTGTFTTVTYNVEGIITQIM